MLRRFVDEEEQNDYQQGGGGPQNGDNGLKRRARGRDYSRYEYDPPSIEQRQNDQKAQLCHFFKNGDKHQKKEGQVCSINRKKFPTLDNLLNFVNGKLNNSQAMQYLFRWPEGVLVNSIDELTDKDTMFVASTNKRLNKKIHYRNIPHDGSGEPSAFSGKGSRDSYDSRTAYRSKPSSIAGESPMRQSSRGPFMIDVVDSLNRERKERIAIDPQTRQNFEDILDNITAVLGTERPPIKTLYSSIKPYTKVDAFNKLFQQIKNTHVFIACGMEGPPHEVLESKPIQPRRSSPMRNGHASQSPRRQNQHQQQYGQPQYGQQQYAIQQNGCDDDDADRHKQDDDDGDNGGRQYGQQNGRGRQTDRSPARGGPQQRHPPMGREHPARQGSKQQLAQKRDDPRKPARDKGQNNRTNGRTNRDDDNDDKPHKDRADSPDGDRQARLIERMETIDGTLDDDIDH